MSVNSKGVDLDVQSLPLPSYYIEQMRKTKQNPRYHGEGNVLNHTLLVLDQFNSLKQQYSLSTEDQEVLYWAALLHDIGKPRVTQWIEDRWSAAGHERAGVPIARDILLQQSQITARQRRRILDLVRWHHLPLRLGLRAAPFTAYHHIAVKTDIQLLGLFSMMDLQGRICENRSQIADITYHFNEVIVPYMIDYWGTFDQLQRAFSRISGAAKNCVWYALKVENFDLIRSIIYDHSFEQPWSNTCYITIGAPKSGKYTYVKAALPESIIPEILYVQCITESDCRTLENFLHTGMTTGKPIIITGTNIDEQKRQGLIDKIREYDLEIHYLFFERQLSELLRDNRLSDSPLEEQVLRHAHGQLQFPHPWEAHNTSIISHPFMQTR